MCGITGIFNLDQKEVSRTILNKMVQSLVHRGPDGEGIYCNQNIGLGHRRLSILDVSNKGAQPMYSHNKEWIVVFNGCIYNFQSLKNELLTLGHSFISTTDTEVISEGLAEWGPKCFERFDGMFAIAAWNTKTQELIISRDRFGVKPLYYYFDGRLFLFASEIKAILEHPNYSIKINTA
ncbi:MAG TPA: asparagine synthetase B, partial [Saprospiraceae bacterium]|nr:asparagine synthetase B [Saprospiraceae bacterium]